MARLVSASIFLFWGILAVTSAIPPSKLIQYIEVRQDANQVHIYGGNLTLIIDRHPWRLSIYDNTTSKLYVQESTEESKRLGFGLWEGKYLNIYEGYLLRIGEIVEWHHATDVRVQGVTLGPTNAPIAATLQVNSSSKSGESMLVTFENFGDREVSMRVNFSKPVKFNRVGWGYLTPDAGEAFYGFGERFNSINQRGHKVGSWLEDGGWGLGKFDPTGKIRIPKGELSTYVPMPLLISSKGYGMQLDMYHRSVFDSKTSNQHMHIMTETDMMNLTIFCKSSIMDTFSAMSNKNGKSLIPPLWAFGPWNQIGDEIAGVPALVRAKQMLFDQDIPFSHSVNTVHYFPNGDGTSPGDEAHLTELNENLLDLGIKSTAYFNAMLSQEWTTAYNYAAKAGYFYKTDKGLPYNYTYDGAREFKVSQMDYSNPEAVKWYSMQLDRAVKAGFKGWMYDYGEYTPPDSVSHSGHDGLYMHNLFPLQYQQTCHDHLVNNYGNRSSKYAPDFVFYVRSGYLGSQKFTWAHWTGDPSSDWNKASGLPAQIKASLNIGISGMPFSGSDIGGFEWNTGPSASEELWARWTQLGCFSGLMHEQGGGRGIGNKTHIFDTPEGTRIWRKYAKLRTQLSLYIYTAAHQARESGIPIMRHPILSFPRDKTAMEQEYQYMFGDSILVAPVIDEGATTWSVYLPVPDTLSNAWIDFSTSTKYYEKDGSFRISFQEYLQGGTTVEVNAPVDVIPTFVKAGDIIITTDPRVQTLSPAANKSVNTFDSMKNIRHVWSWPLRWNDWVASGQLYDGSLYTLYYGKMPGVYCEFLAWHTPKNITHVVQIAGPWISAPVGVKVGYSDRKLPNAGSVDALLSNVDNSTISEWFFDKEANSMWVKMAPDVFDIFVMDNFI